MRRGSFKERSSLSPDLARRLEALANRVAYEGCDFPIFIRQVRAFVILAMLKRTNNNKAEASRLLGIGISTLYYYLDNSAYDAGGSVQ